MRKSKTVICILLSGILAGCSRGAKAEESLVSAETAASHKTEILIEEEDLPFTMDQVAAEEEAEEVVRILSSLPASFFESALTFETYFNGDFEGERLVLLAGNDAETIKIYGYEGSAFGTRGIVIDYHGVMSYFDYTWVRTIGAKGLYEEDFDQDGTEELCLLLHAGHGTGVSTERLILLEPAAETKELSACEFTPAMQLRQIEEALEFELDAQGRFLDVTKNHQLLKQIDLSECLDILGDGAYVLDCLNQVHYTVTDSQIEMTIDIGIRNYEKNPAIFLSDDKGKISLNVAYDGRDFQL